MDNLNIEKSEVLRYLGFKNQLLDEGINKLIEESIEEMKKIIKVRYVYKLFSIDKSKGDIALKDSAVKLQGKDIYKHLEKADKCVLMAITLGSDVDTKIRYYEKTSITRALILDACATTAVEEACDNLCEKLEREIVDENKVLTSRFSPGYGDLPIDLQNSFISVLESQGVIGLTASSHSILLPRKSVTAVVGVIDKSHKDKNKSCLSCNKHTSCKFKKEGDFCEA